MKNSHIIFGLVLLGIALVAISGRLGITGKIVGGAATGSITVESIPSRAEVLIDTNVQGTMQLVGSAPVTATGLAPRNYTVTLNLAGYEGFTRHVNLAAGQTARLRITLTQLPVVTGFINVTSSPTGANISIDEKRMGMTPKVINISVGSHNVVLRLAGYNDYSTEINVVAGKTAQVSATLVATIPTTGSINVTSSPNSANVTVDGAFRVTDTPALIRDVSPGLHQLTFRLAGYNDYTVNANVAAGQIVQVDANLTKRWQG